MMGTRRGKQEQLLSTPIPHLQLVLWLTQSSYHLKLSRKDPKVTVKKL